MSNVKPSPRSKPNTPRATVASSEDSPGFPRDKSKSSSRSRTPAKILSPKSPDGGGLPNRITTPKARTMSPRASARAATGPSDDAESLMAMMMKQEAMIVSMAAEQTAIRDMQEQLSKNLVLMNQNMVFMNGNLLEMRGRLEDLTGTLSENAQEEEEEDPDDEFRSLPLSMFDSELSAEELLGNCRSSSLERRGSGAPRRRSSSQDSGPLSRRSSPPLLESPLEDEPQEEDDAGGGGGGERAPTVAAVVEEPQGGAVASEKPPDGALAAEPIEAQGPPTER